ncbi:ribonuclease H-like domain-containing protein [Tanacetum coccineum]
MPPKYDLVLADEEEYVFSESVTSIPDVTTSEAKTSVSKPKSVGEPLIEDWISDSEDENETEFKSKQRKPSFAKIEFVKSNEHVKTPRESVKKVENKKQAKYPRKNSQSPRDCDFYEKKMVEKTVWNNARRVNHQNSQRMTHPHPKGNFVPKAVLMKSGIKTLNTAGQNFSKAAVSVNTARPINTAYPRPTVNSARTTSNIRRPFNKSTTNKNSNLKEKVNTVKGNVTTAGPKAVVSDNKGNEANVVKASACWVWRPKQKVLDHVSRHNGASMNFKRFDYGNPQLELQEKGVIDSGCSRHMTGNKSYLSDYEEIDGGFVAFGGDPKGGRITGKGKISTGKLDFEDVYFVKELKFNLFSVSQMCDKKNSVLFTDTECVVLSPDFKLLDENHGNPQLELQEKGVIDSGCSRHMTGNKSYLSDYEKIDGRFVAFGGDPKGGRITDKGIENLIDLKVKVIRCDNRTEFKNKVMNQFCEMKGIKREFSVARTPQQNRVAERKNRTLIEAARTMLADSKLPTTFWAEAVNTACYVQNRVLVIKPHNKTPYELFLGKFDGKADEGFFIGYSTNSKAYRVFNSRTRIVEENLHVKFSEETPNIAGNGPNWLFDIDALTISMNYKPVVAGNQTNGNAGTKENIDAGQDGKKIVPDQKYILLPLLTSDPSLSKSSKDSPDAGFKPSGEEEKIDSEHQENEDSEVPNTEEPRVNQEQDANVNNTNNINTVSPTVSWKDRQTLFIRRGPKVKFVSQNEVMGELTIFLRLTHMKTQNPLLKDEHGEEVDVHLYRSMIGSLMYLTSSRPDIMFAVCACVKFQVNPKISHLHVGKRIFRYLKGQPKLGLWYLKDSPFDLVAYTDNDYAGASLDRKSTTGGCQFLGCRLISWQYKKQTVVANSTTKVEYVAASSCRVHLHSEEPCYSDDDDVGTEADMNNLDAFMHVIPIPTIRIHKDHPFEQIIRDLNSTPQTRRMTKNMTEHAMLSSVQQVTNHKDFQNYMFACFLSQEEPKKVIQALKDPSWI